MSRFTHRSAGEGEDMTWAHWSYRALQYYLSRFSFILPAHAASVTTHAFFRHAEGDAHTSSTPTG